MNKKINFDRYEIRDRDLSIFLEKAKKVYLKFYSHEFQYNETEAIQELGLDTELIHQLLEDYVSQIIGSIKTFERLVFQLQDANNTTQKLDYTELRELAHKHLGVAKNLRIKDVEKLLSYLMHEDDLEDLLYYIKVLQASVICLKPSYAFKLLNTL